MDEIAEVDRAELLRELLPLELEYRRRSGENATADEYLQRFSGYEEIVVAALAEGEATAPPDAADVPTMACAAPMLAKELPALPGYEILEGLGRGGMGVVYKAKHVKLQRLVALKILTTFAAGRKEASPGTLKVSDFGLAKRLDLPAGQTMTGAIMGTPATWRRISPARRRICEDRPTSPGRGRSPQSRPPRSR